MNTSPDPLHTGLIQIDVGKEDTMMILWIIIKSYLEFFLPTHM